MPKYFLLLMSLLLGACTQPDETGPGEVRWDKEICVRCAMALSDRYFTAQVRGAPAGQRTKLYKFDDLGCAVIWLKEQPWKDDPRTEIWINDYQSGEWLDARKAHYVPNILSPMGYNLAATAKSPEGALDYSQAVDSIWQTEAKHRTHTAGGHSHVPQQPPAPEQEGIPGQMPVEMQPEMHRDEAH